MAVTLQALLHFEVATLAGFGVSLNVSCAGGHGVLLHSMWVLGGCRLPRRPCSMPLASVRRASSLGHALLVLPTFFHQRRPFRPFSKRFVRNGAQPGIHSRREAQQL